MSDEIPTGTGTGIIDKNGKEIKIGDRVNVVPNLDAEVESFRQAKAKLNDIKFLIDEANEKFKKEYDHLFLKLADAQMSLGSFDVQLRTKALALHELSGDKSFSDGLVTIKQMSGVSYDNDEALAWAISSGQCLKLDVAKFKKVAKILELGFVVETSEPKVFISRKV